MLSTFNQNPKLILFGMLAAFFSGPGQTFLVSVFTPHLENAFSLTSGELGSVYAIATLAGAAALPYLGRLIDQMELLKYTYLMGFFLSIGCLMLSFADSIIWVLIGFFLIRSFGQGAMSLISTTTTARFFDLQRGKAISLATLGHPIAGAVFPIIVLGWIESHGWRAGWALLAFLITLMFFPTIFYLLKDQHEVRRTSSKVRRKYSLSYKKLFKDPIFIPSILVGMLPPFILTAIFFYQISIAHWKEWSVELVTTSFVSFSATRAIVSMATGTAIDRFSARGLYPLYVIPLILGTLALRFGSEPVWSFVNMSLFGVGVGLAMTIKSAFWPEVYGTKYLGSIKGVSGFFAILGTAMSPPWMGWLMDRGTEISSILAMMTSAATIGFVVSIWISRYSLARKPIQLG